MDLSKLSDSDLDALLRNDLRAVSDAGLRLAIGESEPAPQKTKQASIMDFLMPELPLGAIGAGLGAGFGRTVLGGQGLIGKGLSKIGVEAVGEALQSDAEIGRQRLLAELQPYKERSPIAAGAGKIVGEIGATLPVGAGLASGISLIPKAKATIGPLIEAIGTSGARGGGLGTRMVGGGLVGGTSATMVDPESAGIGIVIGSALPVVGAAAGRLLGAPAQTTGMAQGITAAREAGYVIPPTQANPTLINRALEGFSGKISTAQNASMRNQEVTNRLAARSLGLADDAVLSPDVLTNIRSVASAGNQRINNAGLITPGQPYDAALNKIVQTHITAAQGFPSATPSPVIALVNSLRAAEFDSSAAVAMIRQLRASADDAFRVGNSDFGRASKAAANALEDTIETHLSKTGAQDLLREFRDARQLIAKTYSVEKALNMTTGSIDAKKLATQLANRKPLSGELREIAQFAQRFPTAARTPESMGSLPQVSPLDWAASGVASAATGNLGPMAGVMARPLARSMALSEPIQNRLVRDPNDISQLLELLRTATPAAVADLYSN